MMNKLFVGIGILAVTAVIILTFNDSSNLEKTTGSTAREIIPEIQNKELSKSLISNEELSAHNTINDCWIGYKGKVYDVTLWLPKHPGTSQAILPYCGTSSEFEQAFTQQHGASKVSTLNQEGILKGDLQ